MMTTTDNNKDNHTTTNTDDNNHKRAWDIINSFFCLNPHSHISDDDISDHGDDALKGLK